MKDYSRIIYATAGLVIGYFIGFYEMKYKTMDALVRVLADDKNNQTK